MFSPICPGQKVFYNAVGGWKFHELPAASRREWKKTADAADLFSVRDAKTLDGVRASGILKAELIPDTAILMSDVYTDQDFQKNVKKKYRDLAGEDYYILQVNKRLGEKIIDMLTEAVAAVHRRSGIKCVLLPIGKAARHDDLVVLTRIHEKLPEITILADDNNMIETMWLIARSRFYIGSSLHGAITAMSFGVPHTALSGRSIKLCGYLECWGTTDRICVDTARDFSDFAAEVLEGKSNLNTAGIDEMKASARNWLDRVCDRCLEEEKK